jgi:hypothetical protein
MKFNIELIVSIAYFNPLVSPCVEERRVMHFFEMETIKWDANDLAAFIDDIEQTYLTAEQETNPNAFSTCAMVVGMYKDGEFIEDLDEYLFNQGIAYRTDK